MEIVSCPPNYIEHMPIHYNTVEDFLNSDFWKSYNGAINDIKIVQSNEYFGFKTLNPNHYVLLVMFINGRTGRIGRIQFEHESHVEELSEIERIIKESSHKTDDEINEFKMKYLD